MDEPMEWLIEAIQKKQLIEYCEPPGNYWRTAEPHLYAAGPGGTEILIVYQVDVGRGAVPNEQLWKTVEAGEASLTKPVRLFSQTRSIPKQHAERARKVYAQASDSSRSRTG